ISTEFGMQHAFFEMGSADKAQFAVLNRDDRCRSRATVDEGKLAHDRPRAADRQRQGLPTLSDTVNLENASLEAIAAITNISGMKERFAGTEVPRCRSGKQTGRQAGGQS